MLAAPAAEEMGVLVDRLQRIAVYVVALLVNVLVVLAVTSLVH